MTLHIEQSRLDLTGAWSFAYTLERNVPSAATAAELGLPAHPCTVPGNFELDLQAIGVVEEPFYALNALALPQYEGAHIWYWRKFTADEISGHNAELVFHGLDCYADIYLNGELLASCDNMFIPHVIPVDGKLRGENELFIHIKPAVEEAKQYTYPPTVAAFVSNFESLYVRKAPHMYGWDIMPRIVSAGIWRPVELRYRPVERLEDMYLETTSLAADGSSAGLSLHVNARTQGNAGDRYTVVIDGTCGESSFHQTWTLRFDAALYNFTVPQPRRWWPRGRGAQDLYRVTVSLQKNGETIDQQSFTHGIRTVALERTSTTGPNGEGEFCFHVNGEKVFIKGSNWVPADAFHSRDAARIPAMLELAEDIGINLFRCWGGNVYEDDHFFDLCDEKGILIWQDFALACAIYPQDDEFSRRFETEARVIVKRLRRHPCIVLWAGDNECDMAYSWFGRHRDPNTNVLTRTVLPRVLGEEDLSRPYLPSSPYIDDIAFKAGERYLPENHLWGPRDYYKSDFYKGSLCHFASEMGYHGCPSPESIRRFISPEKLWPYTENDEWTLHATSPVPEEGIFSYRVELMANQIRELFGAVPDNLEEFAFASQASQAEAQKFFIEFFRATKWRRTGIIWWNLIDGWPQFSDAVVDYYFNKKLAYYTTRTAQQPLCLMLTEPENWAQRLVASNDTREDIALEYTVTDLDGDVVCSGSGIAKADAVTPLASLPFSMGAKRCYLITWQAGEHSGRNHYLAGNPPFDLRQYRAWLEKAALYPLPEKV